MEALIHFGSPEQFEVKGGHIVSAATGEQAGPFKVTHDKVNHPKHYVSDPSGVECIEITRHRNFNVGNGIKYLWRAGLKEEVGTDILLKEIEDLEKARWYIADEIERLKKKLDKQMSGPPKTNFVPGLTTGTLLC